MIAPIMLKRLLILLLALLLAPVSAAAQEIEGSWDFRLSDKTIFRFDIVEQDDGSWSGTWHRPKNFASDGNNFARLRNGVEKVESMAGYEFVGDVELSFEDKRPNAVPDIFRFELVSDDVAMMTYVGTGLEPYRMVRAKPGDPMGGWDEARIYRREVVPAEEPQVREEPAPKPAADQDRFQILDLPALRARREAQGSAAAAPQADRSAAPIADEAADKGEDEKEEAPEEPGIGSDFLEGL